MRVVPPLEINAERLTACNVAEPASGEAAYSVSTSYPLGARVISPSTHRTYESLAASNLGNPLTDPTKWADIGPTNRYAMFDNYRSTATKNVGSIEVEITPAARIDSMALLALDGISLEITVMAGSPAAEVYRREIPLATRQVSSWSQFFLTKFEQQTEVFLFDIPPYSDNVLTVKLLSGGDARIGTLLIGQGVSIGRTKLPVNDDALNFSKIERDDFGNVTLIPRRSVPTTELQIIAEKGAIPRLRKLREQLNAAPALWVGIDDPTDDYFDSLLRHGIYKNFSIQIDEHQRATISLTIEDL